jgi:hypothetical protein
MTTDKYKLGAKETVYCYTEEERELARKKAHQLGLTQWNGVAWTADKEHTDIYYAFLEGKYILGRHYPYYRKNEGYTSVHVKEWLARFKEFERHQRVQFGDDICIFFMDLGDGTCVLVRNGVKIFALLQDVKPVQVFDERLKLCEDEAIYCPNNDVYTAMVRDHLDTLGYCWSSGKTHRNLFYKTPINLIPGKDGTHYDYDYKNCVTARAWLARHKIFVAGTTLKLKDGKMGNYIRKEGSWVWVFVMCDNECTKIEKYHQDAVELGDK